MRTATSLTSSLMSIILPLRLVAAGFSNTEALSAFGAAMGQAFPLLTIPTTLIGSFVLVLVPEISENYYGNRHYYLKRDVEKSLKFSTLLSCLFVPVFLVCGEEIGLLMFGNTNSGTFVRAAAFLTPLMSVSAVSTSILNSIGLENRTLIYYIIGGVLMLACVWFLPSVIGIYALLAGFTCIYGLTTVLNLILLNKHCKYKPNYLPFVCYSIAFSLPSAVIGLMLESIMLPVLGTFMTFFTCSILIVIFNLALHFGFNQLSFSTVVKKINLFKRKKSV
jgi:stage V sporulation protein B